MDQRTYRGGTKHGQLLALVAVLLILGLGVWYISPCVYIQHRSFVESRNQWPSGTPRHVDSHRGLSVPATWSGAVTADDCKAMVRGQLVNLPGIQNLDVVVVPKSESGPEDASILSIPYEVQFSYDRVIDADDNLYDDAANLLEAGIEQNKSILNTQTRYIRASLQNNRVKIGEKVAFHVEALTNERLPGRIVPIVWRYLRRTHMDGMANILVCKIDPNADASQDWSAQDVAVESLEHVTCEDGVVRFYVVIRDFPGDGDWVASNEMTASLAVK